MGGSLSAARGPCFGKEVPLTLVWPPREDPSVTAEDLGPSTLAASTIELMWPRHRRSQHHGQPPASGDGLPRKWNPLASDWHCTWLVNLLPQPKHSTVHAKHSAVG